MTTAKEYGVRATVLWENEKASVPTINWTATGRDGSTAESLMDFDASLRLLKFLDNENADAWMAALREQGELDLMHNGESHRIVTSIDLLRFDFSADALAF
jgi:hypothetical protein